MTALPEGSYADLGDGLQMHYHRVGDGPPVVFLHGSGPGASGWTNFHANAEAFAADGLSAILPDILGYGLSSKPEVMYDFSFLGGGLIRFCDALGLDRISLVGNSMGGALAIWFALEHPDRVDKLVLMAPGGLEERETYMEMRGIRRMMRALYGPEGLTLAGMHKVFELQVVDPSVVEPGVIEDRFEVAKTQPLAVHKNLRVPHLAPRLGELTCPVLALWGQDDQFCPVSGARRIAENVADARVVTLTRCGHWVMVEHPAVFNRWAIDFLKGRV